MIVSGVLTELAGRYVEQGIPYVVPHPARLYMAHPKWPEKASEPLAERARFYCGRDVERHLRLWKDAATRKGLVQFEAPNDADMHHPKCRDDWPLPLLSSHEEDANDRNSNHGTVTGEIASSSGSMQSVNAEHLQHDAAVKQEPTHPPQQFPKSVEAGLRMEWQRLWTAFQHDVNTLTDSLLHMLDVIHARQLAGRQRLIEVMAASGGGFKTLEDSVLAAGDISLMPKYPKLRVYLDLKGEALFRRTAPGGSMAMNSAQECSDH